MTYLGRLKSIANDIKELREEVNNELDRIESYLWSEIYAGYRDCEKCPYLEAEDSKKDEPKIRCYKETEK